MTKKRLPIKGILCDIDGVLYNDDEPIEGAVGSLDYIRQKKIPIRFLTNTTRMPQQVVYEKLLDMGFSVEKHEIISPPVIGAQYMKNQGARTCRLLMEEATKLDFSDFEQSNKNPDFIVFGDIGDKWSYELLTEAFRLVMSGSKMIALHKDRFLQSNDDLRLGLGAFVTALEYASGEKAKVIGKPEKDFFDLALASLKVPDNRVLMIGDDIISDVGAAQSFGLVAALVQTGKYRAAYVARCGIIPDILLPSIADLPYYL